MEASVDPTDKIVDALSAAMEKLLAKSSDTVSPARSGTDLRS